MQKLKNKILALALTALFVLSISAAFSPQANAALFPGTTIPTWAYLQVVPDTVGIGQNALMVMWIDKPPPTANGIFGDRWINMTIEIVKPDGSKETLGPFMSDDAGGYTAVYSPDTTGTYTAQMKFPGEIMTGAQGNPGYNNSASGSIGDVYGASESDVITFFVQDEGFTTIPENPLPTDYWQHPIQAFNHWWAEFAGNWWGLGDVEFGNSGGYNFAGGFNPYTKAVLAPHIVWKDTVVPGSNVGGQLGGEFGGIGNAETNYYSGFQYQPKFSPIIMNGILYYQLFPNYNSLTQGFTAVNLRTGETLWTKNYNNYFSNGSQDVLLCGQIYEYKTMNTYGGQAYLWATRSTAGIAYLDVFDAATGNYCFSVERAGSSGSFGRQEFMGPDGSLMQLYLNTTDPRTPNQRQWLILWNSSKCVNPGNSQFFNFQQNGNYNYDTGIMWKLLLPNQTAAGPIPSWILDGTGHSTWDPDSNTFILTASTGMYASYGWNPGWVMNVAVDLDTGNQLWLKNITNTPFAATMVMPGASNGTFVRYTKETFTFDGFSVATGEPAWNGRSTEPMKNPLAYYDQTSAVCAYGNLYTWTFGGEVYCFDMTTGAKVWNWSTGETADTPYGVNPLWIIGNYEASVADGMFYVETGHDYGPPLFSGAKIYALNATTGELVWDVLNFASGSSLPVTYGYMLSFNGYDNSIYCWGRGQTATTVETAPVINNNGQILIKGTVTDQSPGQTCFGTPAAGTPAIDDAYMNRWMEYLYMQSPKPTNATGVPVTLSVIDPNNNYYVIGTTVSDVNGQYAYTYTPEVPGTYKITASFAGSNSYYSSTAQTTVGFDMPASATASPTAQPQSAADLYFVPVSIGLLVAIIVVGALLALMIRRRP